MRRLEHALVGWRRRVADAVARPLAGRTGLREEQVRGLLGAAFLVSSVLYVVRALRRLASSRSARNQRSRSV